MSDTQVSLIIKDFQLFGEIHDFLDIYMINSGGYARFDGVLILERFSIQLCLMVVNSPEFLTHPLFCDIYG